ncbi:hypothetical protein ACWGNM_22660 [Streptomyces sp. NPDC055796]
MHTKDKRLVKQEKSSRMAVIAGTGADMDIPNGVIGNGRTRRVQARRTKVIVVVTGSPSPEAAERGTGPT